MGGIGDAISGVGDVLFGSEKEVSTQKTPRLTPEQMELLKKLSSQVSGQVGKGIDPYSGELSAGPSKLQDTLFSILEGRQPGLINALTNYGQEQLTQDETYDQGAAKEYWQQSFVEPAKQQFWDDTIPQLQEQFAGQGALSSGGFNRAVADAAADMNTQLGGKLGEILYQGKQDFANRQLQERQVGLSTLDRALNEMNALMQTGQTQRGIEQGGLDAELQKWQMSQPYNNPWLGHAGTALGVNPYQINTVATGGGGGLMGGLMPGVGVGIGSMFSDSRLKTDVEQLKEVLPGVPAVRFKWNRDLLPDADDEPHIGVIAQDLQQVRPEMVHTDDATGYLRVDYENLLKEVEHGVY